MPTQAAIALEKALMFTTSATAFLGTVITESKATGNAKAFWQIQLNRLAAVKRDILIKIPAESRMMIREDLADEYSLDSFLDLLGQLNLEGRAEIERYMVEMLGTEKQAQEAPKTDDLYRCSMD